ncbi:MAG: glycosyltransferase family 2 protein [Mariniblastus sp.]|nr:glycosyltransferase family 2 protein [Mariniblastus sp.]
MDPKIVNSQTEPEPNLDSFRISVVIPSFNMATTLTRAIESAARQTLQPLEILVVDDGSTDPTREVLQKLQATIPALRFVTQENAGNAAAKNTGIRQARGEWIGFLDADDAWLPQRLEKQVELLAHQPDCVWAAGAYQRIRLVNDEERPCGKIRVGQDVYREASHFFDALQMIYGPTSLWIGTVLAKKTALQELGLFDPRLSGCDDTDLWVQMALRHPRIAFVKQPVAKYTVAQAGSLTSLAAGQLEPSRLTFFNKLKQYSETATGNREQTICQGVLQREIGTYVKALTRAGNPSAAREILRWSRSNQMPRPSRKYTWATALPAPVLRAARSAWHCLKGKLH